MNYKKQNAPLFWFLVVAASLRVRDYKCKAKYDYAHKFWNGKKKHKISL